ncbi:hypothetical protein KKD88_01595, partial [Patescibacteria group bacterium]|nr:hypothetical protein [Patescibacteria group bacterium]MBU1629750.1 hypothetical protein [Patescibacteria group bacterium]
MARTSIKVYAVIGFMPYFAVFGNHPELSLAEFASVVPDLKVVLNAESAAIFETSDWDGRRLMRTLGGTVKLGNIIFRTTAEKFNAEILADEILKQPKEKKILFGFTAYGEAGAAKKMMFKFPLALKRALTGRGRSVRWVTGKGGEPLAPAAVSKLKLIAEGYDIAVFIHGKEILVGLTTDVQNADEWSLRDYGRPCRDDKSGMLPPKLARMMVNLAQVPSAGSLLDPFCGSGTVLMEAALASDAFITGSDIDPRQTEASKTNIEWLVEKNIIDAKAAKRIKILTADSCGLGRRLPQASIDRIVTEGYMGPPLSG